MCLPVEMPASVKQSNRVGVGFVARAARLWSAEMAVSGAQTAKAALGWKDLYACSFRFRRSKTDLRPFRRNWL